MNSIPQITQLSNIGRSSGTVRIHKDLYEQVTHIAFATRRPVSSVASELMRFALAHATVEPAQLYDLVLTPPKEGA